jgi:hypothetical protein
VLDGTFHVADVHERDSIRDVSADEHRGIAYALSHAQVLIGDRSRFGHVAGHEVVGEQTPDYRCELGLLPKLFGENARASHRNEDVRRSVPLSRSETGPQNCLESELATLALGALFDFRKKREAAPGEHGRFLVRKNFRRVASSGRKKLTCSVSIAGGLEQKAKLARKRTRRSFLKLENLLGDSFAQLHAA